MNTPIGIGAGDYAIFITKFGVFRVTHYDEGIEVTLDERKVDLNISTSTINRAKQINKDRTVKELAGDLRHSCVTYDVICVEDVIALCELVLSHEP